MLHNVAPGASSSLPHCSPVTRAESGPGLKTMPEGVDMMSHFLITIIHLPLPIFLVEAALFVSHRTSLTCENLVDWGERT